MTRDWLNANRLTEARPFIANRTHDALGIPERARLLQDIVNSPDFAAPTGRHRHRTHPVGSNAIGADLIRFRNAAVRMWVFRSVGTVGVVSVMLMTILFTGSLLRRDDVRQAASRNVTKGPQVQYAAYVLGRATGNLSATQDMVLFAHETESGPRRGSLAGPPTASSVDSWWDQDSLDRARIEGYAVDGQPAYDIALTDRQGAISEKGVDYGAHLWWASSAPASLIRLWSSASHLLMIGGAVPTPLQISEELRSGALIPSGHQLVGDHEQFAFTDNIGHGTSYELWVDAATYLVVRTSFTDSDGARYQSSLQWLPRDMASEADLSVQVPSGFTRSIGPPSAVARTGVGVG